MKKFKPTYNEGDVIIHESGIKHKILSVYIAGSHITYYIDGKTFMYDDDSNYIEHDSPYYFQCELDLKHDRKRKLDKIYDT